RLGPAFFTCSCHRGLRIENDQGRYERALVANDTRLTDERLQLERILQIRGRDVLPAGSNDDLFFSIDDPKEALGIDLGDVTEMRPSLRIECFSGQLRFLVVSRGNVAAADEQLAVGRQADLDTRHGRPDGADLRRSRAVP